MNLVSIWFSSIQISLQNGGSFPLGLASTTVSLIIRSACSVPRKPSSVFLWDCQHTLPTKILLLVHNASHQYRSWSQSWSGELLHICIMQQWLLTWFFHIWDLQVKYTSIRWHGIEWRYIRVHVLYGCVGMRNFMTFLAFLCRAEHFCFSVTPYDCRHKKLHRQSTYRAHSLRTWYYDIIGPGLCFHWILISW